MQQKKRIKLSFVAAKVIWPVYLSPIELAKQNMAGQILEKIFKNENTKRK